jgi:hypothetical protein
MKNFICSTWNIIKNNCYVLFSKKVVEIQYTIDSNLNNKLFFQMFNNDFNRKLKELRKSEKVTSITINFKIQIK